MPTLDSLRNRAEAIHRQYDAHFAGQPRISRDASLLDAMVVETDAALKDAAQVDDAAEVVERLKRNRAMYVQEAAAIRAAQAQGPAAFEAHRISTWAGFISDQYRRHFAGKSRATRDLGLLAEMLETLEQLESEAASLSARSGSVDGLADTRAALEQNLTLYRQERQAIAQARGAGTLAEQGDLLATVANDQFALYRTHFAGKARVSRRPGLLVRMISSLESVADRMRALRAQGLHAESNDKNLSVVEGRLTAWRGELEAIRGRKQETNLSDLVNALGNSANTIFQTYRENYAGKDRATRDLELLGQLLDQMLEIARQMEDLDRVRDDPNNQHNLSIVMDHLRLYTREYQHISEAQRPQ